MKPTRLWFKRVVAGMATLMVGVTSLFAAGSAPAHAEENTQMRFEAVELQQVNAQGNPVSTPGQLYVGDFFYLNLKYDASQANPQPGDSFTIELPAHFANRDGGNAHREIIKPLESRGADGSPVRAGDCKIEERKITCTFNDAIAGKVDIKGSIQAQIVAFDTTTATEGIFRMGGQEFTVAHPWGEDIQRREKPNFTPGNHMTKGTKGVGFGSTEINWFISFGGGWLGKNYPNGGPITITDEIQAGMEVPEAKTVALYRFTADPSTGKELATVVARADGSASVDGHGIEYIVDGNKVTFALTGPFSPEYDYRVNYDTKFTGGTTIVPGFVYRNKATFQEIGVETKEHQRTYFESFRASVDFSDGFGGFSVTKASAGSALPPAGQTFQVRVAYTLPDGKSAADYPGWNAPENPSMMTVTVGSTTNFPGIMLPMGTEVTLTEDVATADPQANGLVWGAPQFSSQDGSVKIAEDKSSATFTIANKKSTSIMLTNTATGLGTFSVAKQVTGDDAEALADQEFTFAYTCGDESGTVTTSQAKGAVTVDKTFVDGTTCTVTEQTPANREGYTLTAPEAQQVTIKGGETIALRFTNAYSRDLGTFVVAKQVEAAGSTGSDEFTIAYECVLGDEKTADSVKVAAGGETVVGQFPAGTECKVVGESDAERAGYSLDANYGDAVTIAKGETAKVTVTNTYSRDLGTFVVAKQVEAAGSTGSDEFTIAYECVLGDEKTADSVKVAAGGETVVGQFPAGTECKVIGESDAERAGYSLDANYGDAVTIAKGETAKVTVTNTYSRDLGTFAVAKQVEAAGSTGSDEFELFYKCSVEGAGVAAEGSVKVAAGGETVVGQFPVGASCEVVREGDAERAGYSLSTVYGDAVTIAKGETAKVTVTNTYTEIPVATPTPVDPTTPAPVVTPSPVDPTTPAPVVTPSPVDPTTPAPVVTPSPVDPTTPAPVVTPSPVDPTTPAPVVTPSPVAPTSPLPVVTPTPAAPSTTPVKPTPTMAKPSPIAAKPGLPATGK